MPNDGRFPRGLTLTNSRRADRSRGYPAGTALHLGPRRPQEDQEQGGSRRDAKPTGGSEDCRDRDAMLVYRLAAIVGIRRHCSRVYLLRGGERLAIRAHRQHARRANRPSEWTMDRGLKPRHGLPSMNTSVPEGPGQRGLGSDEAIGVGGQTVGPELRRGVRGGRKPLVSSAAAALIALSARRPEWSSLLTRGPPRGITQQRDALTESTTSSH